MKHLRFSTLSFMNPGTKIISIIFILFIFFICLQNNYSQSVFVDSNTGDDGNPGTEEAPFFSLQKAVEIIANADNDIYEIKINPGLYVFDKPLSILTDKEMVNKRIIIEANILPGDPDWKPEKMPVVFSISKKGEIPNQDYHFVAAFLIEESHVTIRGLKFPGYFYPNTRYFPIARFNKSKTDLYVEQCLFVGDEDASHLQVGIMAHGNEIRADHCIFYNVRNSVVFWEDAGGGSKSGNGITNSIIYGATQSGVWTAWPDNGFIFKNNIVSNCKYAWIKNYNNPTVYSIDSCIIVNNQYDQAISGNSLAPQEFAVNESNVIKEGEISLRPKSDVTHYDLPVDYLHIIPGTLGSDMDAGLIKKKVTDINNMEENVPKSSKLFQNYPNPFNPSTIIRYSLSEPTKVILTVYNLLGEKICVLRDSFQTAGEYSVTWDATNINNGQIPSGIYFCKLETGENTVQKKMVVLR